MRASTPYTKTPRRSAINLAVLVLAILVIAWPLASLESLAAEEAWYSIDLEKGIMAVTTDYFNLTYNLSRGAAITSTTLFYGGEAANPLEAAKYLPSLFLFVYSNTSANAPGRSTVQFTYNNETYTASYPGLLASRPWAASVVYSDNETLVVRLEPGQEASTDIEPVKLYVYVRFYRHLPIVEYTITFTNPSNEAVRLYSISLAGSEWGPIIELVGGDGSPQDWNLTVLYTLGTGGVKLDTSNETDYVVDVGQASSVEGVALVKASPEPRYLVALEPYTKPALVQLLKGYAGVVDEAVRARLVYPTVVLPPGGNYTIHLRLAFAWWDPGSMSLAGLASLYYKIAGPGPLKSVYEHDWVVDNLTRQISDLQRQLNDTKAQLEDARKKAKEASRRAGELEGLLSKCRADYNYTATRLNAMKAEVKKTGMYAVTSLIIGVVLGLAGYRYALQPLLQASPRRRR
jgi:hypothetical protein